ncbi:uncharacterized protein MONOS_13813 [Monocercomonoides exilis]|uniref:uncharacterized protein n=1 Tax=Monocercomonoides exilis TaxID=2049356 RepID=UPI003559E9CF|nr:hypothetical protein MONOS_13813 [Monocercomonoides exilis]|eukprot:MONOS_13813.1-p1 / transcript=MONOS_13813.1 / gene=MONOS_13813 / organism=Monocercomonoides_exilis_PA203 / gene_product=unspecified product / transcript_product=unspecified product / location=Mono_scaffold00888:12471-13351(-) / protein_length=210 / sequence_SO=supercontig / SO=protein_coding / is_pseudo=false
MDDIERWLRIVVPEAAGVYGRHMPLSLQLLLSPRVLQTLQGICCGAAGCAAWECSREVGEIVEKGLSAAGLRMEDVVLLPEEIVLVVLEEREEAEEGDVNEVKGGYPAAHREFVERVKKNQGKPEEVMAQLNVETLGLSRLRFVKADTEVCVSKQHPMKSEVCSSSPSDGIQQENRRASEEEATDMSFGAISDGSEGSVWNRLKYQLII